MAWYRAGGGGIPSSLKTGMNDILNKKFGTSQDYPPTDWAPTVNLMGPLPEKTVSGAIATFADGADDVPTKSLVVTIPPTLTGVSSVTETQTGKNLLDNELTTQTVNGTTFTVNADKSITISGTPSATTRVYISRQSIEIKAGSFFSFGTMPTGTRVFCSRTSSGSTTYPTISPSHTATIGAEYTNFLLEVLTTFDGTDFTIYPQLEFGSTAHAYEPYETPTQYTASLGRTIYGGTADVVNGQGKEQYQKVKISDLTWQKQTASGRDFFIATINDQETTNTHDVAIDIAGLSYAGMVTVAGMSDKSLAKWLQSVRIYDTSVSSVSDLLSAYGNGKIVFYLKDTLQTDFTFDGQEINTRLGVNNIWNDSGDTEVTYRADINLALGGQ